MNRRRREPESPGGWVPHRAAQIRGALLLVLSVAAGHQALFAQPFPGPTPTRDTTGQPLLHVDATVHKMLVQAVESDGTLWLDFEGRAVRVRLEDVALPLPETVPGQQARKLLGRFVGRTMRFAFRGVGLGSAAPPNGPPPDRFLAAYAPIIDRLLESGLARYCPGPGRTSSGLLEIEERARQHGVGIWQPGATGGAPPCERPERP